MNTVPIIPPNAAVSSTMLPAGYLRAGDPVEFPALAPDEIPLDQSKREIPADWVVVLFDRVTGTIGVSIVIRNAIMSVTSVSRTLHSRRMPELNDVSSQSRSPEVRHYGRRAQSDFGDHFSATSVIRQLDAEGPTIREARDPAEQFA
jgi:hypothetical protein